jgi:hypothetical protein
MTIFNSVFTWFMKKRIHQIELFMKYPNEVQEEWFEQLITRAENTEWGKKHHYKSITNLNEFKERVPIQTYDTLKPYIERMLQGEQNVLWPSEIRWFAKSSGTTNDRSKFIPVSEDALEECHFKGGRDLLTIYFNNRPDAKMFTGKILTLGGSHQISQLSPDTSFGDLSAVLMKNLPLWAEFHRTPDLDIALLENFEEKIERMAYATKDVNVTSISGVPTGTWCFLNVFWRSQAKKICSKYGPTWKCISTAQSILRLIASSLKGSSPMRTCIIWRTIMRLKDSSAYRILRNPERCC